MTLLLLFNHASSGSESGSESGGSESGGGGTPNERRHAQLFFARPGMAGVRPPTGATSVFRRAMTLGLYHIEGTPIVGEGVSEGWCFGYETNVFEFDCRRSPCRA